MFLHLIVRTKYEFTVTFIGSDDDGSDANRSSSSDLTIIYTVAFPLVVVGSCCYSLSILFKPWRCIQRASR